MDRPNNVHPDETVATGRALKDMDEGEYGQFVYYPDDVIIEYPEGEMIIRTSLPSLIMFSLLFAGAWGLVGWWVAMGWFCK